jgi:hypothetical protein
MYILKIKGSSKIPDYIQIRDSKFTLVAYFRADTKTQVFQQFGLINMESEIKKIIHDMPYGKILKLSF